MAIAFGKGFQNNELDNQQNVFKIAKLRFDRAYLDMLLMPTLCLKRMAESPEKVKHSLKIY
jgi:peptidyl-dipeptidase Dcp